MKGGRNIKLFSGLNKNVSASTSEAFNTYYEEYYPIFFRHCAYLTGNLQSAEDIDQEAFIKLYNSPPNHGDILPWLSRVATNLAYNYIRDQKTRKSKEPVVQEETYSDMMSIEEQQLRTGRQGWQEKF